MLAVDSALRHCRRSAHCIAAGISQGFGRTSATEPPHSTNRRRERTLTSLGEFHGAGLDHDWDVGVVWHICLKDFRMRLKRCHIGLSGVKEVLAHGDIGGS